MVKFTKKYELIELIKLLDRISVQLGNLFFCVPKLIDVSLFFFVSQLNYYFEIRHLNVYCTTVTRFPRKLYDMVRHVDIGRIVTYFRIITAKLKYRGLPWVWGGPSICALIISNTLLMHVHSFDGYACIMIDMYVCIYKIK